MLAFYSRHILFSNIRKFFSGTYYKTSNIIEYRKTVRSNWTFGCSNYTRQNSQNLWKVEIGWDDPVPEDVRESWLEFSSCLPNLERTNIPWWTVTYSEMHGFCDASERAYAAALYVVTKTKEGISAMLLTAKAKVAPINVVSIPRLELCGALLLARLGSYVISIIESQPVQLHCWTESEIV